MTLIINGQEVAVSGGAGLPEGTVAVKPITKAEYDALTDAEKQADVMYAITDDAGSGSGSGSSPTEVYSTEETRIGTWIDGKPLYRKVSIGHFTGVNVSNKVGEAIENLETVTYLSAITLLTNGSWTPFPYHQSTGVWAVCQVHSDNIIYIQTNHSVFVGNDVYVEVRYTKTTDEAML